VLAGKTQIEGISFNQLAVTTTSNRIKKFRTQTRIYYDANGEIKVSKKAISGESIVSIDKLSMIESNSTWNNSSSLQTLLYNNCMSKKMSLSEIFLPCKLWIEYLESASKVTNGDKYLDGHYIDSIFSNIYLNENRLTIIDKEWIWKEKIKLNVIVIRAIFNFLHKIDRTKYFSKDLQSRSLKKAITLIAKSIGITLNKGNFSDFIQLESEIQSVVYSAQTNLTIIRLQWVLFDSNSYYFCYKLLRNGKIFIFNIKKFLYYMIRYNTRKTSEKT